MDSKDEKKVSKETKSGGKTTSATPKKTTATKPTATKQAGTTKPKSATTKSVGTKSASATKQTGTKATATKQTAKSASTARKPKAESGIKKNTTDAKTIEKQVNVNGEPVSISVPNQSADGKNDNMNINLTINLAGTPKKRNTTTKKKAPAKKKPAVKKEPAVVKQEQPKKKKKPSGWWLLILLLLLLAFVVVYFVVPRSTGKHIHSFADVWTYNTTDHWHICKSKKCDEVKDKANHSYDNDCDTTCNICGHTRVAPHSYGEEYESNVFNHWKECPECHTTTPETIHIFSGDCDTACNICGYIRAGLVDHTFGTEWYSVEDGHFHKCTICEEESTPHVAHTFKNGICDVCTYAREELSFSYDGNTNSYTVTDIGRVTATDIVIPATYDDGTHGSHPVTSVDDSAFVSLYASSPSNITSVTFSNNMETIGPGAFFGCENLTTVTLSSTIKEIGNWAFSMTGLTSINIPASVETMGTNPFTYCEKLTAITVDSANTKFHVTNNCLIDTVNKKLIIGLNYNNIPSNSEEVTTIGYAAFAKMSGGTTLKIPSNITTLDDGAFSDCTNIVSVELPNGIGISNAAFDVCTSLTTIYYAGTQAEWSENVSYNSSYNTAFVNATRYYYSENEPMAVGKYWHYVEGVATPWAEKMTYKVEHYVENENGGYNTPESIENLVGTIGSEVTVTPKTYAYYTHDTDNSLADESGTVTSDGNLVLKVYYTRNSYTLTLAKGTGIASVSIASSSDVTTISDGKYSIKHGEAVRLMATAESGYTFSSWTGHSSINSSNVFTMPTENVTITANAIGKEYDLTFSGNATDDTTTITPESKEVTYGSAIGDLATATRTGFTFAGWYKETGYTNQISTTTTVNDTNFTVNHTAQTITIYAKWNENHYTIAFNGNGGAGEMASLTNVSYSENKTLTANAFEKTGYTFIGWSTDENATTAMYTNSQSVSKLTATDGATITLYAVWTADTNTGYTVKHYKQKLGNWKTTGLTAEDCEDEYETTTGAGETDTQVTPSTKSYDGFTAPSTQTVTIAGDGSTVVNYFYLRNSFDLTLSAGTGVSITASGTGYDSTNNKAQFGAYMTLDKTVSAGYTFGAYSSSDVTISNGTFSMPAKAVTITATATTNTNTAYTVEYYLQNLADNEYTKDTTKTVNTTGTTDTAINLNTYKTAIAGFEFGHSDPTTSATINGNGNTVVKLYYTRNTYTLTLIKGTGIATVSASGTGVTSATSGYTVKYDATVTLSATASVGYTFSSWTGYTVTDNSFTMPAENVTLTATATANTNTAYKVEHYQEELSGDTYTLADTENLTGTTGATVTATAKTDYNYFTHDTTNANSVESGTIAGDGTLTLKVYYKRKTGTLLIGKETGIDTVSASGTSVTATTGTADYAKYRVKYGAEVTLTATASTGYTLAGWEKGSLTLSGNTYTHNALEIMVTAKATANTYSLTYDTNGGNDITAVNKTYNTAFTSAELPTPTKAGYTFAGWYNNSEFTNEVEVNDLFMTSNATFANVATASTTATIYAKWTENTYTISFDGNGGTGEMDSLTNVAYSENKTLTANTFEKEGYTFVGWSTSSTGSKVYDDGQSVSGLSATNGATVTLYAVWIEVHEHNYSWDYNSTNHWQICSVCDATTNTGTHSYGTDGLCTTCGRSQLQFEYNTTSQTYTVKGAGTFTGSTLAIPSTYNDGTNGKKSVTSIAHMAFYNKDSITSVSIPATITNIYSYAFKNCSGLTSLTVDEDNSVYHSTNNCIIETATKTLCVGSNNATIPTDSSEVTIIGAFAFSERVLTIITIPSNITTIGDGAFCLIDSFTSLTIPGTVKTIGNQAFLQCNMMTILTIEEGVETLILDAFQYCKGLETVSLPASLTSIEGNVFRGCCSLATITVDEDNTVYHSVNNCVIKTAAKTLVIGCRASIIPTDADDVTIIGDSAFYGVNDYSSDNYVQSITIPANIEIIGNSAFMSAEYQSIVFAENSGLKEIGNLAFAWYNRLTTFIIPDGVTTIGDMVFEHCTSLTTLVVPTSVTTIGSNMLRETTTVAIYYAGTQSEWEAITIDSTNTNLNNATKYYYSETQPTDTTGNYWHYVSGVPTAWTTSSSSGDE